VARHRPSVHPQGARALHKDNWEAKLANPARVAVAPSGAAEEQAEGWFRTVMAWGVNTVFGMRPGYDVKLIESNGRGFDSFNKTIADQNNEMIIAVAGQTVTT
jgi:phage gp29-like protein